MKEICWDSFKNEQLKTQRGISFEEVSICIAQKEFLSIIENPSQKRSGQRVFVISFQDYVYYVPFVEDEEKIFLKTVIPSRKLTKKYLEGNENEKI